MNEAIFGTKAMVLEVKGSTRKEPIFQDCPLNIFTVGEQVILRYKQMLCIHLLDLIVVFFVSMDDRLQ